MYFKFTVSVTKKQKDACNKSHPVLHCASHCMGSDNKLKPSSFGSQLRRTSESVPIHGEPKLEGFFIGSLVARVSGKFA